MHRRVSLVAFALAASLAGSAAAADKVPFTPAAFEAAKAAGKPVLVEVTAPWCPTCKVQRPILSELTSQPKFKDLSIFEVDFDSQKDALRAFKVQQQSTLIAFKAGKEVARSTGDTVRASISALLDKAI